MSQINRGALLVIGRRHGACSPAMQFLQSLDSTEPLESALDQLTPEHVPWLLWLSDELDDRYDELVYSYRSERAILYRKTAAKRAALKEALYDGKLTTDEYSLADDQVLAESNRIEAEGFLVFKEEVRQWLKSQ